MESEPRKVTVVGAALIVAAVIAVVQLRRYFDARRKEQNPPKA